MALRTGADIFSIKQEKPLGCLHFSVGVATVYRVSKSVYQLQVFRLFAVCQIPRKTDAVKAGRKHMLKKHTDEIRTIYGHRFLARPVSVILIPECDIFHIHTDNQCHLVKES